MSYHAKSDMGKKSPQEEIAMPPLPPEVDTSNEQSEQETAIDAASNQSGRPQSVGQQDIKHEPEPAVREESVVVQQQESAQAKNFRELREQKERIAKERDDMARRIKELEQAQNKDPYSLAPDDLVEGKHLSHHANELKQLKEELSQYKQQWHQNSVESKLRARYNDFDSVVNQNTLSQLSPAVAQSLKMLAQTDLEAAGEAAYDILRARAPQQDNKYAQDVKTAQANSAKPRPVNSISPQHGETPLSQANAFANGLTPELQKKLLEEMNNARRSY